MSSGEKRDAHCLTLSWAYGLNSQVPVLNMTVQENRTAALYACSNTAVWYECHSERERLLQGHRNEITCLAVSPDKRWVVTADAEISAPGCSVIIWDMRVPDMDRGPDATPVQILYAPLYGGCTSVDLSSDARFLATLSCGAGREDGAQVVSVWEWSLDEPAPLHSVPLKGISPHCQMMQVLFNKEDNGQLVCTGRNEVAFVEWSRGSYRSSVQTASGQDFNRSIGEFTLSQFVPRSPNVLTLTSEGNILVWTSPSHEGTGLKRVLKLYQHQEGVPLTCAQSLSHYLVLGNGRGEVSFLDPELKLTQWKEKVANGPINSISFALAVSDRKLNKHLVPKETTIEQTQFSVPNFMAGTMDSELVHVTGDGHSVDVLKEEHSSFLCALATHPSQDLLAMGGYSGRLKLWDYTRHKVLATRQFPAQSLIFSLCYDSSGGALALGLTDGTLFVLDAISLSTLSGPLKFSHDCVTKIVFSPDNRHLALCDADCCVVVFSGQASISHSSSRTVDWSYSYLAKYRSHYKPIVDLMFHSEGADGPSLYSLGWDRLLIRYDLARSSENELVIGDMFQIEQSASPTCLLPYPPLSKEAFFLVANNQFKLRLYNTSTFLCRKTVLGPAYGDPVQRMLLLPQQGERYQGGEQGERYQGGEQGTRYLAFITHDKVGMAVLPMTGNPYHYMSAIAHPGQVVNVAASHDGRFVFTAGGEDCCVFQWRVNTGILDAHLRLGGTDMTPFYELLDGGRGGEFYREMEEQFYYAQIKSQGVEHTSKREVGSTIQAEQIPNVIRALGFFPSEKEISDILNEVKFSEYIETGEYTTSIDLEAFIRLYINHRPAYGLHPFHLEEALQVLGDEGDGVERGELLELLESRGEQMTEAELADCLATVLGLTSEEDPDLNEPPSAIDDDSFGSQLPEDITVGILADKLLGAS